MIGSLYYFLFFIVILLLMSTMLIVTSTRPINRMFSKFKKFPAKTDKHGKP